MSLGNIIDFDPVKSRRNMKIGYYDAKRTIYGLKGRIYYIEENREECYYLKQLLQISPEAAEELQRRRRGRMEEGTGLRRMMEEILPGLAPGAAAGTGVGLPGSLSGMPGGHRQTVPGAQIQDLYGGRAV